MNNLAGSDLVLVFLCLLGWFIYRFIRISQGEARWTSRESHDIQCTKILNFVTTNLHQNRNNKHIVMKRKASAALTRLRNERILNKDKYLEIDVSKLTNVIADDIICENDRFYIWVECGVTMNVLVNTLLSIGYLPCVIPEFKHITCAGACNGFGIESSSFKYGLFHETVIEYECLLIHQQRIVHLKHNDRDKNNRALFNAIPGSLNSLGVILLAIKIQIIQSKPWVQIQYKQVHHRQFIKEIQKDVVVNRNNFDFVEAIRNEKNRKRFIICKANMVDEIGNSRAYFSMKYPWHQVYYRHVLMKLMSHANGYTEYMAIYDYLFRHDRYCFWAFIQGVGSKNVSLLFRVLFGWLFDSKSCYVYRDSLNIADEGWEMRITVQDYIVTQNGFNRFYNVINMCYPDGPIWFCPLTIPNNKYIFTPIKDDGSQFAVNIGVYLANEHFAKWYDCYYCNNVLESECALTGFKWYYASSYLNESDFYNKMFDNQNMKKYFELRKRLRCDAFNIPTIYGKCGALGKRYQNIDKNFTANWLKLDPYQLTRNEKETKMDARKHLLILVIMFVKNKLKELAFF